VARLLPADDQPSTAPAAEASPCSEPLRSWRRLVFGGYLRRHGGGSRLHVRLRALALLREARVEAAASAFEAAVDGATAAQLDELLRAARPLLRLAEPQAEAAPEDDEQLQTGSLGVVTARSRCGARRPP